VTFDERSVDSLSAHQIGAIFWYDAVNGVPFGGTDTDFGRGGVAAASGDSLVAIADGARGRITWYRFVENRLAQFREISLGLPLLAVTQRDLDGVEAELRAERVPRSQVSRISLIAPEYRSHFGHAVVDNRGSAWLERVLPTGGPAEGAVYLVVALDGQRREVRLPVGFKLRAVQDGFLFGTNRTDFDVPIVQIYELVGG
jgi:hypothetical protein